MNEMLFYRILLFSWLLLAPVIFCILFFLSAPYGRHSRSGWGSIIKPRIGWVVMEAPAALGIVFWFCIGEHRTTAACILLLLWETHYVFRAFIYPFLIKKTTRQMPVVIMLLAILFNMVNTYLNGRWLTHFSGGIGSEWLSDPRFLAGCAMFITGWVVNHQSDFILLGLRKRGDKAYYIPHGGLFRWISCPNYFGEILEWTGWALAAWSLAGLSFALWTLANLLPRALTHHKWYRDHFEDYPEDRKAVIPGIL
jgi:protein-S-isoprenylcysteine O-methyltransferase Ste14